MTHSNKSFSQDESRGADTFDTFDCGEWQVRDREKVLRGLKKSDTPILTGYQLFHNYMRPHMALDGKTSAEMCGIDIGGDNKWKTLIQNARREDLNLNFSFSRRVSFRIVVAR